MGGNGLPDVSYGQQAWELDNHLIERILNDPLGTGGAAKTGVDQAYAQRVTILV